jgi:hypothetical protein
LALISPPPNPFKRDASWFRPGMIADRGGVYIVHHYQHQMSFFLINGSDGICRENLSLMRAGILSLIMSVR